MNARLLLEDGTAFDGVWQGAPGERMGEVVLYTGVVGYQEVITDPANAGKILVFTYPLIGNYGTADRFSESQRGWAEAVVIKERSRIASNWLAEKSFADFLTEQTMAALEEVDTRTLAVKMRDEGVSWGIISGEEAPKADLLKRLQERKRTIPSRMGQISVDRIVEIKGNGSGPRIAVLDLGMLRSFLRQLQALGCMVQLLPHGTSAGEILGLRADGLILSNGPEEDASFPRIVEMVRTLLGKIPLLGISTGHEILAQALGGNLQKMPLGHHGANCPLIPADSYRGEISFQNHSFTVVEESLPAGSDLHITFRNLNDRSIEEMESPSLRLISAQYYPVSPGFDEVHGLFTKFLHIL